MTDATTSARWRAGLLAAVLIASDATRSIRFDGEQRVIAETNDVRAFYRLLPLAARDAGVRLYEIQPADESLNSVFAYLVAR